MALPSVWISFELVHMHLRTRLINFYFLKVNFFGENMVLRPTSFSAVTTVTIHRPIQIWLFLFIPPDNLPPHKKWRGVKILHFQLCSLSWRIALKTFFTLNYVFKRTNDFKTISNRIVLLSRCVRNLKPFRVNKNRSRTLQTHTSDIINILLTSSSRSVL